MQHTAQLQVIHHTSSSSHKSIIFEFPLQPRCQLKEMFSLHVFILILVQAAATYLAQDAAQSPIAIQSSTSKSQVILQPLTRVAIIGSCITGTSVAYSLQNEYGLHIPFEISVYEMNSQVGGRTNFTFINTKLMNFVEWLKWELKPF